jgi:cell division protein FtsL
VLLSALIVGVVLSCAQIVFDAYKTRQAVAGDAQRILDMFRDPRPRRSTAWTGKWACR